MKIGFVSLGCCKNLVDSEQIMSMIKRGGHEIVANPKDAQAIIVNTCGFIESAKEESSAAKDIRNDSTRIAVNGKAAA